MNREKYKNDTSYREGYDSGVHDGKYQMAILFNEFFNSVVTLESFEAWKNAVDDLVKRGKKCR